MKIILTIFLCLFISQYSNAQLNPKFNIKVVDKNKRQTRGVFYAITDHQLILVKNNSDTIKLEFVNVKDIYISKRGVILPFMIIGATVAIVAAAQARLPLQQFVNILYGIPLGVIGGNLVGQLFANKRFYRGLEAADFATIKTDLERYTQVINYGSLN